jgi:ethanolamine utilization microcompartment shell protein EutL
MKDVNSPPQRTTVLQKALKHANIEAPAYSDPSLDKNFLILLIAPKER